MLASYCLSVNSGRRQKERHPTIFESEEGCRLLGSCKIDVCFIVIRGNIVQVSLEVLI